MSVRKKSAVEDLVKLVSSGRRDTYVIAELLTELMSCFGGPTGFAREFHTHYRAANKGGLTRARMLDSVLRLVQLHTANLRGKDGNLGTLSDAEIASAAAAIVGKADGSTRSDTGAARPAETGGAEHGAPPVATGAGTDATGGHPGLDRGGPGL